MTAGHTLLTIELTDDERLLMCAAIDEYCRPAPNAKLLIGPIVGV